MSKQDDKSEVKIYSVVIAIIAVFIIIYSIVGCSPRIVEKVVEKEKVVYRDSTIWRDSLIRVPLPLEKDQAIVHVGDTSKLETTVAESMAYIGRDGLLHHSLKNKKGSLSTVVKIPSKTVWVEVEKEKESSLIKTVEVEKKLSWWQRFRIGAFWPLLSIVIISLLCLIYRIKNISLRHNG